MIASKMILVIFFFLAISQSIVESCNSGTGSSSSASCSNGTMGLTCNDDCKCKSDLLMTCIEYKCACTLKSQGGFGATCNSNCPCKTNLGLQCTKGVCKCNSTVALWDIDQCVNVESTTAACDALVSDLAAGASTPFKTNPSVSGWKCVASTRTLYGPEYNESSVNGKYWYPSITATGSEAYNNCTNKGASRIQPSTGDTIESFFLKFATATVLVGVSKNNQDGSFNYDNKTASALTIINKDNGCVTLITDGTAITYTSVACAGPFKYMCAF